MCQNSKSKGKMGCLHDATVVFESYPNRGVSSQTQSFACDKKIYGVDVILDIFKLILKRYTYKQTENKIHYP